ncbi:MAG: ATP-binding protein [Leptospiraceae bacterium]|nr:ATP-binding protein [Leptospiraceae bacterium]
MLDRLNFSPTTFTKTGYVKKRLKLDGKPNYWTFRIGLARSLQNEQITEYNAKEDIPVESKEIHQVPVTTFEQKDSLLFRAILNQHYEKKLSDDEYVRYLQLNIERGIDIVYEETSQMSFTGFEYIIEIAKKGMKDISSEEHQGDSTTSDLSGYTDILKIKIGLNKNDSQPIYINFNKTDEHQNNYIGVMGGPGSGKTYFIKNLVTQIRKLSNYRTNFIFFDYKGDVFNDYQFIKESNAEVIQVHKESLPINVFELIGNMPREKAKKFSAQRIVDIVKNVEANIGKIQEDNLYNAIIAAYDKTENYNYPYPDFHMIRKELENINSKPDSLTSVLRPLTDYELFVSRDIKVYKNMLNRSLIIDIHELPSSKELCVFFILNEIYRRLMSLPDSYVDSITKAREMRTIVVIDEAHHFLKSKKRVGILENMIREIRSKGASVFLLSQSPDDYDQADFNFLELLEFVYVLNCRPSSFQFLQQVFGIPSDEAKKLLSLVAGLNQGEGFGKDKNKKLINLLLAK